MNLLIEIWSSFWFQTIFKLVLGFMLAGIIGLERSSWNKPAGFRTHSLLGISAVLIMLCGEYMAQNYNADPTRISAQLLSGIGFIGAGTILRDGFNVKGLTTAAGLLAVTCIGLSIGAGYYLGGIVATAIIYCILSYSYKISDKLDHFDVMELHINILNENALTQIEDVLNKCEIEVKEMSKEDNNEKSDLKTIRITAQYNKNIYIKNDIVRKLASIENVKGIIIE